MNGEQQPRIDTDDTDGTANGNNGGTADYADDTDLNCSLRAGCGDGDRIRWGIGADERRTAATDLHGSHGWNCAGRTAPVAPCDRLWLLFGRCGVALQKEVAQAPPVTGPELKGMTFPAWF
jgi:hypothetical protein